MRKLHDISDNLSTDAVRAAPAPPRACSHPLCLLTPCALLTLVPAHPTGVGSVGAGRRGMQWCIHAHLQREDRPPPRAAASWAEGGAGGAV